MNNVNNEPSNHNIEDYNGKESKEKRNTVRLVVILIVIVGGLFAYLKSTSAPNDYVGTPENPGINKSKNY